MMRLKIFVVLFLIQNSIFAHSASVDSDTLKTEKQNKVMFFADVSPLFFVSGGWGFALGAETGRIQAGINFVGVSKLQKDLSSSLFLNYQDLEVKNNLGAELILNYFLKRTRKGFYASGILGYSQFNVRNLKTQSETRKAISFYGDLRVGFRWFPFKKYLYIDGAFGFSQKIVATKSSNYTFKSNVSFFPFLNIGARFNINKPNSCKKHT
jgi:hypothetical protein